MRPILSCDYSGWLIGGQPVPRDPLSIGVAIVAAAEAAGLGGGPMLLTGAFAGYSAAAAGAVGSTVATIAIGACCAGSPAPWKRAT